MNGSSKTNAKFPKPDAKFDAAKRETRWKNIKTSGKERTREATCILPRT